MRLTKTELREKLGLKNDAELADFFGITRSAVSQWKDDDLVPELRQLQAERLKPTAFEKAA